MRYLITGVAGFIGSHLAGRLIDNGHEVTGLDNFATGRASNVPDGVVFWHRDIIDWWPTQPLDGIIHCAASYKNPRDWRGDARVNTLGTAAVCKWAETQGCPVVYFQTALPPTSSYAISKTAGEAYVHLVPKYLVFRLSNIYGPRNVSGPIPTFFKRLVEDRPCTVVDTSRDLVYIDDLVNCVVDSLQTGRDGTWDICSGIRTSVLELYRGVHQYVGGLAHPKVIPVPIDDVRPDTRIDRRPPCFTADTDLLEGIYAACDWYRDNGVEETYTHLELAQRETG